MKGITLIEILVASIISVIVLAGTTLYITQALRFNQTVLLQSKAQNIVSMAARQIEDDVKRGATVYSPTPNILYIYGTTSQINPIKTYRIDSNSQLLVTSPTVAEKKVIPYANVSFAGTFMQPLDARQAKIKLRAALIDLMITAGTDTMVFVAICRNKFDLSKN